MPNDTTMAGMIRKLADDLGYGRYGKGDDLDGGAFWQDWDTLQDELLMYLEDPNAD